MENLRTLEEKLKLEMKNWEVQFRERFRPDFTFNALHESFAKIGFLYGVQQAHWENIHITHMPDNEINQTITWKAFQFGKSLIDRFTKEEECIAVFKPGMYKSFKGVFYYADRIVTDADGSRKVLYYPLDDTIRSYTRDVIDFFADVSKDPRNKTGQKYRFERVNEHNLVLQMPFPFDSSIISFLTDILHFGDSLLLVLRDGSRWRGFFTQFSKDEIEITCFHGTKYRFLWSSISIIHKYFDE